MKIGPYTEEAALETLPGEFAYRYEDTVRTHGYDIWAECSYRLVRPDVTVSLGSYPVIKFTPKGFWIDYYGTRKFILRAARKRFACLSLVEARESFLRRKQAQVRIYKSRLKAAELALEYAEKHGFKPDTEDKSPCYISKIEN